MTGCNFKLLNGGIFRALSVCGEKYTDPYNLHNDTMYAETCAAIGLCFFARRLLTLKSVRAYADTIERCIYNILSAAISQDGYITPLEVNEEG